MIYHDVEQGSEQWFLLRRGTPTASEFSRIITPAKGQTGGPGSKSYMAQLIGELLALHCPVNVQTWTSRSVEHGREFEPEARRYYAMERNVDVINGGFCLTNDKRFGASPDGLIGPGFTNPGGQTMNAVTGALELKCLQPQTHAELLMGDGLDPTYKWQVHGHLLVTGAAWCDWLSYCPGLPPILIRVEPNAETDKLRAALEEFHERFQAALNKIKGGR
jgi:hypothetical protein